MRLRLSLITLNSSYQIFLAHKMVEHKIFSSLLAYLALGLFQLKTFSLLFSTESAQDQVFIFISIIFSFSFSFSSVLPSQLAHDRR